eukprot:jgi/Botrbrau1/14203/Bobra.0291s0008.1
MLRALGAAALLAAFASVANAHLCGFTITNVPVFSFGNVVGTLYKGTAVSFSSQVTQGVGLGDVNCYVTLQGPVDGKVRIHSGHCHHPTLYDYPQEKIHAQAPSPAPAPQAAPSGSPARKLLQEGDGDVEDDTWYIDVTGEC